jgi:ArsR family transcriptional regulator
MNKKCLCLSGSCGLPEEKFTETLDFLRVVGDPTRLQILYMVRERELCVCEILEAIKLPQNLVSHHLRVLREAGLIVSEREGKFVRYSSFPDVVARKMDEVLLVLGITK